MLTARDIMTKEVITATPETPVSQVAKLLDQHRISGVPVVDREGRMVGVITQSDLVARAQNLELPPTISLFDLRLVLETPGHFKKRLEKMLGTTVGEAMTAEPLSVSPETPLNQIADLMARKKVHTIPVLAGDKLIGVIGKIDLIQAQAREPGA
ncbi:MAG: CBS domain-containing protein [Syntrophales bacterium]|nr:CBS domain-containing protein [Syntrophales bacterium]